MEEGSKRYSTHMPEIVNYNIVVPAEEEIPLNDWVTNCKSLKE